MGVATKKYFRVRFVRQWQNPLSKFLDPPLRTSSKQPSTGYTMIYFPCTFMEGPGRWYIRRSSNRNSWQNMEMTSASWMPLTKPLNNYELPLFFISVWTNVDYSPVAQFITQNETAQDIHIIYGVYAGITKYKLKKADCHQLLVTFAIKPKLHCLDRKSSSHMQESTQLTLEH